MHFVLFGRWYLILEKKEWNLMTFIGCTMIRVDSYFEMPNYTKFSHIIWVWEARTNFRSNILCCQIQIIQRKILYFNCFLYFLDNQHNLNISSKIAFVVSANLLHFKNLFKFDSVDGVLVHIQNICIFVCFGYYANNICNP